MKENNKPEKHEYKIKFEFKNGKSYTLSYSYDSKSQSIKYENVKLGPAMKLKKFLEKQVLDLESALVYAMQQNEAINLTEESIKNSKEQIKNNLVNLDLGEGFLIDIMPDIFSLKNLCKNNLKVVCPDKSYVELDNKRVQVSGKYQEADCQKSLSHLLQSFRYNPFRLHQWLLSCRRVLRHSFPGFAPSHHSSQSARYRYWLPAQ